MQAGNNRCEFTARHYLDTLSSFLDSDYKITPVGDYFLGNTHNKHILLRHDVDLSLDHALEMALLEKDNGIRSTYYILLHSDLYSAMSLESTAKIRAIREAHHEIGLHIDTRHFAGAIEFEILSQIAEQSVIQWSKHLYNLTPEVPAFLLKSNYGNADTTLKAGYQYISDSAMFWKNGCACQQTHDKIHLLVHPAWHLVDSQNQYEILDHLEANSKHKAFNEFRELLKQRIVEATPSTATTA